MVCCPITNQQKGYPFEVELPKAGGSVTGVALADQVKSLDWNQRKAQHKGKVSTAVLNDVFAKIQALLKPTP